MDALETPQRIEPARLEETPEIISDLVAELAAATAKLGAALHPQTAANLAQLVRVMNSYYSNLIEGHVTRPKDIVRALEGKLDDNRERRNLQMEAAAHVRLQAEIDAKAAANELPEPASSDFIRWLHREFYQDAPKEMLTIRGAKHEFQMEPGAWRSRPEHRLRRSEGTFRLPAASSTLSCVILRNAIASRGSARRDAYSLFLPLIIVLITFIRSRTGTAASAAS